MGFEEKTINSLCDDVETYGKQKCIDLGFSATVRVYRELNEGDCLTFSNYILMCVASDGILTTEEYEYSKPIMSMVLEKREVSFEDVNCEVQKISKTKDGARFRQKVVDSMIELLSRADDGIKGDLLNSGIFACACDGKVCESERVLLNEIFNGHR